MMKTEELKNSGLLRIKVWEPEKSEDGNGRKETLALELPAGVDLVKLKVQESLGNLLGARVQIRENDIRLLSIQQELRTCFESGRTGITAEELMDCVRHYFRIRKT